MSQQCSTLTFVSAVFDPLGICSAFTIRMQFLLKSIWAAMGQAWNKELLVEYSKLFSDWCSELKETRTISINRENDLFENGCTNLRLHISTDASGRSDVHRGISARRSNIESHLCDRKMPGSTYQTHDDSEVRTSSRSLRSSSQEEDFEGTKFEN